MAIKPYYDGPIGSRYNNQELSWISMISQALDLKTYPIHITPGHFGTIDRPDRVFSILTGTSQSPSVQAGVSGRRFPIIQLIDSVYKDAMTDYRETFLSENNLDESKIRQLIALPDCGFCSPIVHSIIEFYRMITSYHERVVVKEGSSHRSMWLVKTGCEEKRRLSDMKDMIEKRCFALIKQLDKEVSQGFLNTEFIDELDQLQKISKTFFLESDSTKNVSTHLENFKNKFPTA